MTEASDLQQADELIELLEAQNTRLRRLLDSADAPSELRHRLRSTIGLLRSVIRGTASTRRDVDDYVAHLDDRLEAIIRAQEMADTFGAINLRTLLTEQMLFYRVAEGDRLTLEGPDVSTSPRIGQALALAIHELAVNSVEYGSLGGGAGHVSVQWSVSKTELTIEWRETDSEIQASPRRGFGYEFITQGLPYQLNATTSLSVEPGEVQCTIRVPLPAVLQTNS